MSTYVKCGSEVEQLADELIEKYHSALKKHGVKIDYLFALSKLDDNGDPVGPAIKANGYPALGMARIIPLKDRVGGRTDVEVILDGQRWETLADDMKAALLDHELSHFQVKLDENGDHEEDDCGRPKISMRLHDVQVGWFADVAARHGAASVEVHDAQNIVNDFRESIFSFLN